MHETQFAVFLRLVRSPLPEQIIRLACVVAVLMSAPHMTAQTPTQRVFFNPIYEHPDPFVTYADGFYYLLNTNDSDIFLDSQTSVITVTKASSLAGLARAEPITVWTLAPPDAFEGPQLLRYARPDLPNDVHWYLYYTVYTENNASYVLESDSPDPQGSYHFKAALCTGCWDLKILQLPDQSLYLLATDGSIFLEPMLNPYTLVSSKLTYIAHVDQPWESDWVEAPVPVLHFNAQNQLDQLSIVYSSNDWQTPQYALGLLKFLGTYTGNYCDDSTALLNPANWVKVGNGPIFGGSDPNAQAYGAATFTIFPSPDGTEWWFAYCAWRHDPTNDSDLDDRDDRAQRLSWNQDGTPNLGSLTPLTTPVPLPSGDPGVASDQGIYPGAWYRVFSQNVSDSIPDPAQRLCLDNQGGGSSPGANVELYPCTGFPPQDWQVLPSTFANGYYKIMNLAAGLVLDDDAAALTAPAHVQLWTDNFSDWQRWQFADAGGGYLTALNRWTQINGAPLLLDDTGGGTVIYTLAELWTPNGRSTQNWMFAPEVKPGLVYQLVNQGSQLCLRADTAISGCDDTSGALNWQLQDTGQGDYLLLNGSTGYCLSGLSQSASLQAAPCDFTFTSGDQRWLLTDLFNGYYQVTNETGGAVLDGSTATASLQPVGSDAASAQAWRLLLP